MKKIILLAVLAMMMSTAAATEISFAPDHWDIQKWCLIATDVVINTDGKPVAATDVVIETSLAYVDFVPSKKLFPNFFKFSNIILYFLMSLAVVVFLKMILYLNQALMMNN